MLFLLLLFYILIIITNFGSIKSNISQELFMDFYNSSVTKEPPSLLSKKSKCVDIITSNILFRDIMISIL